MRRREYVKPVARLLDRSLAVSVGGCLQGSLPGTCGKPGYSAGTCDPTGSSVGVDYCQPGAGVSEYKFCQPGLSARSGCSTGMSAMF